MPTLILPPRYSSESNALRRAALSLGWAVDRLLSWRAPEALRNADALVLYGEPLFAAVVADGLGLALLEPPFRWLSEIPPRLRGREVVYTTFAHVRSLARERFVKPADDKSFPAAVYPAGADIPGAELLPDDLPVLVQEPVHWELELRCFVLEGEVLTLSPYSRHGELAQAEDGSWPASEEELSQARAFCAEVLRDPGVRLPPAVTLDVGRIQGRGWAPVELNPAWGSGIYGCNPAQVLRVVQRACVPRDGLTTEDRRWLPERSWND